MTNLSAVGLVVPVAAGVSSGKAGGWLLGSRTVTVGPGATVATTRQVSLVSCGDTYVIRATANPEPRAFEERSYADNSAAAATMIAPCDSPELPGLVAGPGRTIIVMPDFIPNPDPTSQEVCANYDLTWD